MFKKKNIIILSVIALLSLFAVFSYNPSYLPTDAGFDTDYDSGGGSDWSSGGGSDWDYDSDGESSEISAIIFIIVILVLIAVSWRNPHNNTSSNSIQTATLALDHQKEISEDDFNTYLKDKNTTTMQDFLDKRYADLVVIQEAWMNFDYDTLRRKTTDELYNEYSMQLDTLKEKGQKNIMEEFVYNDAMVTNVTKENGNITVTVEIITNFYDYIVNSDGRTVRGHKNGKVRLHYELTFIKSLKKSKIDKCPACGAPLEDISSQQCSYCKSTIIKNSSSWILSKKEAKGQEWK